MKIGQGLTIPLGARKKALSDRSCPSSRTVSSIMEENTKSTTWKFMGAISVFVALANPLRAQHYAVRNLGTLGGVQGSSAKSINNGGWVAGYANLAGDMVEHAALWRDGVVTDLGTLGGSNSAVFFPAKNNAGLIAGYSQISNPQGPVTFCTFVCTNTGGPCQENGNQPCRGFVWRNGVMNPLGTLGGNNSLALGVNDRGLVVGTAENNVQDASCIPPQSFDYKAVTWLAGKIHELPAFPGDPIAAAVGVNDNDQVVGASGNCGDGAASTVYLHAILWQNPSTLPTDLGNLGGAMNNLAYAINERGQIVGASDLTGDNTGHRFLWQQESGMTDLGTLTGDFSSVAYSINNKGQVVGQSCNSDLSICRAFLWKGGVMTDLNTLIPSDSPLFVISADDINDRGEIVGIGLDQSSGEQPAFLAVPCDEQHVDDQGCQDAAQSTIGLQRPKVVLSENIRQQLQQQMRFGRFGVR